MFTPISKAIYYLLANDRNINATAIRLTIKKYGLCSDCPDIENIPDSILQFIIETHIYVEATRVELLKREPLTTESTIPDSADFADEFNYLCFLTNLLTKHDINALLNKKEAYEPELVQTLYLFAYSLYFDFMLGRYVVSINLNTIRKQIDTKAVYDKEKKERKGETK